MMEFGHKTARFLVHTGFRMNYIFQEKNRVTRTYIQSVPDPFR